MRVVTRRTGISPEVLRIWERRYGVVKPARTQTGRRLYSDAEIERLHLLFRATQRGHSIGLIASLSTAALADLLRKDAIPAPGIEGTTAGDADVASAAHLLGQCLRALQSFQPESLGSSLQRAALSLPATQFLESVVEPFVAHVEARGGAESLRSVHAYLTSVVVRQVLERAIVPAPPQSPKLLVVTLPGQAQPIGALSLAVLAAAQGWSVTWLGTGLSADEIAEASEQLRARAVALSLTGPTADAGVLAELRRLPDALPPQVRVIARSARGSAYVTVLDEISAVHTATISGFAKQILELGQAADGAGTAHARAKRLRKPR